MKRMRNHLERRVFSARCMEGRLVPCFQFRRFTSLNNANINADTRPITFSVEEQIRQGTLLHDQEQMDLAFRLDDLRTALIKTDAHLMPSSKLSVKMFSDAPPKGLFAKAQAFARLHFQTRPSKHPRGMYIHGSVGVGKSFLMDLFCHSLEQQQQPQRRRVRRAHFHELMLDVHDRIHQFKRRHPKDDPLPSVALSLAQEARLLCLDEFQVTDIADAMILKRLLSMLWMDTHHNPSSSIGMVLVATSNRAPEALYEGGLNRALFLPFIPTLKKHMDVVEMGSNKDYRREQHNNSTTTSGDFETYFSPADSIETKQSLERIFARGGGEEQIDSRLPVRMGRHVKVPRANDHCAWFDFKDLCDRPLGAADYLSICERYSVLIVDNVPQLNASRFNQARRFVTLVDALYESKTKLIVASQVPLTELLVHFDATVESNDGDEEIAVAGIGKDKITMSISEDEQTFVKGEGGSSSSAATTMIRTKEGDVEWSATGRIGVSLAQLSAVQDVSFSFQRAESRLVEMNSGEWGRQSSLV